jgi:hypothetical protein
MRIVMVLLAAFLGACTAMDTVHLRNPATGQTAQCGPFMADLGEPRGCLDNYAKQGFERVP